MIMNTSMKHIVMTFNSITQKIEVMILSFLSIKLLEIQNQKT